MRAALFLIAASIGSAMAADDELSDPAYDPDNIYLTSYSADAVRVRVSVGTTVLGTFTLPARQLDSETDTRQIAIPLGTARGRPKFEVLDSAGNIITSRESEVAFLDVQRQRGAEPGRNLSLHTDYMPIPVGTAAAKASLVKVSGDRAEGNSGTSVSTFRVTLDKPAPADSTVNWTVSSSAADATDFYQIEETTPPPPATGPQCANVAPPKPASDIGATQLVFCDDFSTDTVARGATSAERNIDGVSKKWTTERAIFYSGSQPAGDFKHDAAAGTMRIAPSENKAQSAMQSVGVRDGKVTGFYIGPAAKYYVEYRFKLEKGDGAQPALWSMDMCHWLSRPYTCAEQSSLNEHLEIDVFEYNNGKATVHKWREKNAGQVGVATGWADSSTHINCGGPTPGNTMGTFTTYGWQSNNSVATFFKNDVKSGSLGPSSCSIPWGLLHKGRFPLLIGGKVGDVIVMDYVRVWKAP